MILFPTFLIWWMIIGAAVTLLYIWMYFRGPRNWAYWQCQTKVWDFKKSKQTAEDWIKLCKELHSWQNSEKAFEIHSEGQVGIALLIVFSLLWPLTIIAFLMDMILMTRIGDGWDLEKVGRVCQFIQNGNQPEEVMELAKEAEIV